MKRDTEQIINQGREVITERIDMTVGEMQAFYNLAMKGEAFEAIRRAFLLGVGVGYRKGKQ